MNRRTWLQAILALPFLRRLPKSDGRVKVHSSDTTGYLDHQSVSWGVASVENIDITFTFRDTDTGEFVIYDVKGVGE